MPGAPFEISEARIEPGTKRLVRVPVARIPTGQSLDLPVHVVHGASAGPVMFVSAALHGDELNGTAAIHRLLRALDPQLLAGTVLAVPVINGFGVINKSRYLPDRRDLNRSFPGSAKGSLTAQLAHLFLTQIVARCSFGIDLHTGSAGRANLPQIRCDFDDARARELASAFRGRLMLHVKPVAGSLRVAAAEVGTTVILHEAGEAHRLDPVPVAAAVDGVLRVLARQRMWQGDAPRFTGKTFEAVRSRWVRATRGGICEILPALGEMVEQGTPLSTIYDPSSMTERTIPSPHAGLVIGVQRDAVVYRGDALVHIAETDPATSG